MTGYYNIKIDKKVTNFNDGAVILHEEIKKLHTWERFGQTGCCFA